MSGHREKAARRRAAAGTAAAGQRASRPFALAPVTELEDAERARLLRRNAVYVIAGAVLFAAIYGLLSWLKYRAYMDARFDLGNMVQAVYNTAHGHFLEITTGELKPRQMSRLGSHVDPILALFALPWLVWPSPVMLLVLQAVIVATGAWPAYRLGTRVTRDPRAGAFLAGAYLLYPAVGFLVLNEFHPVALATPLLLWAFLYIEEGRWLWALPFIVLAAVCKETVPLVIGAMGVYFAIRKRSWRPLILTAAAAAYFAVAVWVIIPHFNGDQSAFIARYGDYGQGAGEVVKTAVTHPGQTVADVAALGNLHYWLKLLWPLGFASVFSPLTVLIAAPELLLNALSATTFQRRIEFHYTALEIPFLFAAAVLGVMRLWRWLGGGFRRAKKAMAGQRERERPHEVVAGERRARRGGADNPGGRQGVGQQQRRRSAVGAAGRLRVPVLRRRRLGAGGREAPLLLRQRRHPDAPARARQAGARQPLRLGLRQGRGVRLQAGRIEPRHAAGRRRVTAVVVTAALPDTLAVRGAQATQLNTANLAVSATSRRRPTTTTALWARGRSRVNSASATYSGNTVSVNRGYDIRGTYCEGKKSG